MTPSERWEAHWTRAGERLRAYQPSPAELHGIAPTLSAFYNEDHNRIMMANTVVMTAPEVAEHYAALLAEGGRPFVLERNGELAGDADFRHVEAASSEFAILIGRRPEQGKGLGTRFATLLHAWAFLALDLERLFVSIIPANLASQRLFAKLGYRPDDSPAARRFADQHSDLTFALDRATFVARHESLLPELSWSRRA